MSIESNPTSMKAPENNIKLNVNVNRSELGFVDLYIHDAESHEELGKIDLPSDLPLPEKGDIFSFAEFKMTGRFGDTDIDFCDADADDLYQRYEVVNRRMNYSVFDMELEDEDVEQAVQLRAHIHVEESPVEDEK